VAWDLINRGGKVVLPDGVRDLDIAVEGDTIAELGPSLSGSAKEEIDATGLHVFPGVIDPHVHFNEPGRTDWEGFATGSAALAAGGGTCFFDMPLNSSPPTLDLASFDLKREAAEASSITDFALWGGLTPRNPDQLRYLADHGAVGFKAFMCNSGIADFPRADDLSLHRGMQIVAHSGLPVAVHAESQEITTELTREIRERGAHAWEDYLASRPLFAELEAIQRAIFLARDTGCGLHVVHVTHSRGVELVYHAAELGADVTCETCPHYLALTGDDLIRIGAPAKCSPPLRRAEDSAALWYDLINGKIRFVGSDHSPAPASMKTGDDAFAIWGGVAGVQSTLSILLSHSPTLPLEQVAKLTSTNVADRFNIPNKGRIGRGFDADLAIVDFNARYTLRREDLLDRHKLSPYVGREFRGKVRRTMVRGTTIFLDGNIVGRPRGGARLIKPARKN